MTQRTRESERENEIEEGVSVCVCVGGGGGREKGKAYKRMKKGEIVDRGVRKNNYVEKHRNIDGKEKE